MVDSRFFFNAGPFLLGDLAKDVGAELASAGDAERSIVDVAPLDQATGRDLTFLDNRKYIPALETSQAAACILKPELRDHAPETMALLLSNDPYRAYAHCAQRFYPRRDPVPGISSGAHVDDSAELGEACRVEAGAWIGPGAKIGARTWVHANAVIGQSVCIGAQSSIGANASLQYCEIGNRVIVHQGACIGQDGFGFAMGPQGHLKIPQLGRVIIHDDVEIGANASIDRGAGPDTIIGAGTKIDNLVQIAHNVEIGRCCVIVAQVGISGSTKLGDFVVVGGQAGFTGHLTIGSGARFAARSGVMHDVAAGAVMGGNPAIAQQQNLRRIATLDWMMKQRSKK